MQKKYTFKELEKMNEDQFSSIWEGIDEDQALFSDVGGDSDADDDRITTNTDRTTRITPTSKIVDETPFDSDDSIADPDFLPDNPVKTNRITDSPSEE